MKLIACDTVCCYGENNCFIPIPPNTIIAINVEALHSYITDIKSATSDEEGANGDRGGHRPHCDCVLILRVNDCPTRLVVVAIELKNLLGLLANYIAAQIISKVGLGVEEEPEAEFIYKLKDKMSYCASLAARFLQPLLTTFNNLTVLCSIAIQYDEEIIDLIRNLVYRKTGKEINKVISTNLIEKIIRKIANEIREALKLGCRTVQKQGVYVNTMSIRCNIDVGTLLRTITEACKKR